MEFSMSSKKLFFSVVCFLSVLTGYGQETTVIETEVATVLTKSQKFIPQKLDSALIYVEKAEKLATQSTDKNIHARIAIQKAGVYIYQRNLKEASAALAPYREDTSLDSILIGKVHQNMGSVFLSEGKKEKALEQYLQAIPFYEQQKDTLSLSKIYASIGSIQSMSKNNEGAIAYFTKALTYKNNNPMLRVQILSNLSLAHYNTKAYDEAITTSKKALVIAEKINHAGFLAIIYTNLCNFYKETKAYDTGITYGEKALALKTKLGQKSNLEYTYNNIGYCFLGKKDFQKAKHYFLKALSSAPPENQLYILNNLKDASNGLQEYKEALRYAEQYVQLSDSLQVAKEKTKIAEIVTRYESEKQAQQIEVLQTENELKSSRIQNQKIYVAGIILLTLLLISILILWNRNQKNKQLLKQLQLQQRLLQTQLNPHFLFHALQSIQNYIFKNKKEESIQYLASFSTVMRSVLESSEEDFIIMEKEVDVLSKYLHLQQLHYSFAYNIEVDERLQQDSVLIPTMFTEPFLENAVIHGIKNVKNGYINVRYALVNKNIEVTITDNGNGFQEGASDHNKLHKSMSSDIIQKRRENYQKIHNFPIEVRIKSDEKGSIISINFPLKEEIL